MKDSKTAKSLFGKPIGISSVDQINYAEKVSRIFSGIDRPIEILRPRVDDNFFIDIKSDVVINSATKEMEAELEKENYDPQKVLDLSLRIDKYLADQFHYKEVQFLHDNPDTKKILEYKYYLERLIKNDNHHSGNLPFTENLLNDIRLLYNYQKEKNELEGNSQKTIKKTSNSINNDRNFSLRQIAIAYFVMNITITEENASEILKKHSAFKSSAKLLQKRISKVSDLTNLSQNKTKNTKHLNDLKATKRLISGEKEINGETSITRIITAFETAYKSRY